jgi:hypothetical protein
VPEWGGGRTTLETIVQELQRPVNFDETFERRVMTRVRRLHAERRSRGWVAVASRITHRPGWAAALAASVVAVVTLGLVRGRTDTAARRSTLVTAPIQFVLVAPEAHSVAVVGDFNDWGLNDSALVATNHEGVWSVTAPVPAGVHRYAFLVNGKKWVADPSAPRATDDDFGMPSSALVVEDSTR